MKCPSRLATLILASFFILCTVGSQGHSIAVPAGWQLFAPADAGFVVLMPSGAKLTTEEQKESPNGPYKTHILLSASPGELIAAGWVVYAPTYKPSVEDELKANVDNFVKGVDDAKLISTKRITYQNLPAMEFLANAPKFTFKGLFVMDGRKVYTILAGHTLGEPEPVEFKSFFSSFKVLK